MSGRLCGELAPALPASNVQTAPTAVPELPLPHEEFTVAVTEVVALTVADPAALPSGNDVCPNVAFVPLMLVAVPWQSNAAMMASFACESVPVEAAQVVDPVQVPATSNGELVFIPEYSNSHTL